MTPDEKIRQIEQANQALELRLSVLEKSRRHRRLLWISIALALPLGLWAATTIPNTFNDGDTLSAAKLNENFQALAAKIDAMEGKTWRLIYETDVTSATTSVNVTGLDGNTDHTYRIIARIVNGFAGASDFFIRPNSDSNTANFGYSYILNDSGAVYAPASQTPSAGLNFATSASLNQTSLTEGTLSAKTGLTRQFVNVIMAKSSGSGMNFAGVYGTVWNNTTSNISSLQFFSNQTNGIGAGSHIEIWARR